MKKTSIAAAVALVATIAAPNAFAGDETAALRAVRDKETGQLRAPTQDEAKELNAAERAARKARGLPEEATFEPVQLRTYENGMKAAVLGADHLVSVVAERDADGKLVVRHANPADEHVAAPAADQLPTE
jgi:uncharacterized protein (DUF2141 family)